MTNAIILNTLTGAVSEYTGFGFQSITPTLAGSATGLFALGGDADAGVPVVATVTTGKTLWGDTRRKLLDLVYFSIKGGGTSTLTVHGESDSWSYDFPVRSNGESRAVPGRGIRENYLAFGYSNADGSNFQLDRIEVGVSQSKNRRT